MYCLMMNTRMAISTSICMYIVTCKCTDLVEVGADVLFDDGDQEGELLEKEVAQT